MEIKKVTDAAFRKYGRVISEFDFSELVAKLAETPLPEGVVYEPSVEILEALPLKEKLETAYYGELPIQIGYCNGHNHLLNAVEYHRSSEVDIAADDLILLLGSQQDITDDYTYETSKIEVRTIKNKIPVDAFSLTFCSSPAPKCCATTTPLPEENPVASARKRNARLLVVPTAEKASSPKYFPIMIVSIVL